MIKKLLLSTSLALASGAFATTAYAADLGGDCCADLEERVAVLESTTARKGNRKVSLTISGVVYQQLLVWDDGLDSDAYIGTNLTDAGNHVKFTGDAKINSDWSAGYAIQIHLDSADGFLQNASNDDANAGITIENSYMWIQSEQLGRLGWGRQSQATDNIGFIDLSGAGSAYAANLVTFDGAGFNLIKKGTNTRTASKWADIAYCQNIGAGIHNDCNGDRTDNIRYDSPTIAGFVLSASWGEDDLWDVALRYSGEINEFKLLAGVGYSERDDLTKVNTVEFTQAAFSLMHMPTGLFVNGVYGVEDANNGTPDTDTFYIKAGIRQRLNTLGATVIYGEYGQSNDGFNPGDVDANTAGVQTLGAELGIGLTTGSEFNRYGLGVVQEIDAASMAVFAKWKRMEGDVSGTAGNADLDAIDLYGIGGVIFF